MDDSSDDDSFVVVGTALSPYVEGETLKKPVPLQDQEVKDSKGRARFHGAFTGGFSAGYFNTVGSKEGFTPSVFVSSRNKAKEEENEGPQQQKPEDFMDDEDFGEHGIAPKVITTTTDFTSKDGKRKVKESLGEALLNDLVIPARISMGIKLLRDLGWKDGQGIGARRKKKSRKKTDDGKKLYGCALPNESEESEDEFIPDHVTFAPKDVNPVKFETKDNMHGLGYSGIKPGGFSQSHFSLFSERTPALEKVKPKEIGISGQAFGVGDFEDEDDVDVYATDNIDRYDRVLGGQGQHQKNYGWTAPKHKGQSSAPVGYLGQVLEGFKLSKSTLKPKKIYPPPQLPKNFKPFHAREDTGHVKNEGNSADSTRQRKPIDANVRKAMLGEINSVFDLLPSADKARIEAAKDTAKKQTTPGDRKPHKTSSRFEDQSQGSSNHSKENPSSSTGSLSKGGGNFKPFASDPDKQLRYEQYLESTKKGNKEEQDTVIPLGSITEWERNKEKDEFSRAAKLYRPLSGMMASRFTSAKYQDSEDIVKVPEDETTDKSDQKKAVDMKMFGRLTRERFEWHPDRFLCKCFNVANPYPGSTMVGVPKVKRDKYSVFTFLNQHTEQEMEEVQEKTEPQPQKPDVNLKPLAILAQEDSSLQSAAPLMRTSVSDQATAKEQQSSEDAENTQVEEPTPARPTMDIFKAIFSDSSDEEESSSSEKDDDIETIQTNSANDVLTAIFGTDSDRPSGSNNQQDPLPSLAHSEERGSIAIESLTERLSPTPGPMPGPHIEAEVTSQKSLPTESRMNGEENICGPALPPGFIVATGEATPHQLQPPGNMSEKLMWRGAGDDVWVPATQKSGKDTKKHKKHSLKKKKSKHKKHKHKSSSDKKKKKHKKKQKKKKEVVVISSTSNSNSSEEESGSDTDHRLIERLRSIPKDRRPKASDFM